MFRQPDAAGGRQGSAGRRACRRPAEVAAEALAGGTITALRRLPGRLPRCTLYVDGMALLSLDEEVIARQGLSVGRDVSAEVLREALVLDQNKQAGDAAVAFLARRPRTRREVERRLEGLGFSAAVVTAALGPLMARGYIDDAAYARQFAEQQSARGVGPLRVRRALQQKGVPSEVVETVLRPGGDQVGLARQALQGSLRKSGAMDRRRLYRRLAGFLLRRGFDCETVRAALNAELGDDDGGET